MQNSPTEKQLFLIEKTISYYGKDKVCDYLHHFYPEASLDNLDKTQAQKIITGLYSKLPRPIIKKVFKRDYKGRF